MVKIGSYAFETNRSFMSFDTLEELRAEVRRYFTKSEQYIVDRLCDFSHARFNEYGMAENSWRHYSVIAYLSMKED